MIKNIIRYIIFSYYYNITFLFLDVYDKICEASVYKFEVYRVTGALTLYTHYAVKCTYTLLSITVLGI